ncbi:MAG TPA: SDR family oxidoreductase [Chthoniobacterales bacterium]|nr:SDR family oxidoreductase [Chthoniobacterales bacterium]
MNTETTLITGASSGIGFHLARQFARHQHPLVLVAPVESELKEIAADLGDQHGVSVQVIAKDLEQPGAADEIFSELAADGVEIEILVNNAGHGQKGRFWDIPVERDLSIVSLNIEAVLRLTKLFLQPMIQRGRGRILNVASIAGFEPGPLLAVYHASKAFVLSWSEALATELKDNNTGVSLTTLCPGPTDTDFFEKADMVATRAFQKADVMPPQEVAEAGYKALMDGDRLIVPGAANKAIVFSRRFLPATAQAKMHEKLYSDVKPEDMKRLPHEIEAEEEAKNK